MTKHWRDWVSANREFVARKSLAYRRRPYLPTTLPHGERLPEVVQSLAPCTFVLSTGRCGTLLLTNLLQLHPQLDVHHKPAPELAWPGRAAYEGLFSEEQLRAGVLFARYELVRDAYCRGLTYVETNNRITFLAPQLAQVFAQARFIHLVRHPADFVRSGMRRGYYQDGELDEVRIHPPVAAGPNAMSRVAKVAWLWNETNAFITRFLATLPNSRKLALRAEDLFDGAEATLHVFDFLDLPAPGAAKIAAVLRRPVNENPADAPAFPQLKNWAAADKSALREYAPLAASYGYRID